MASRLMYLQWVIFDSPSPCLCPLWLGQCVWRTCWRLRQKSCQIPQTSNVLDNQVFHFLLEKPSLAFLLSPYTHRGFSWCPSHSWPDLILLGTLAFLTWSWAAQTISSFSLFLQGYMSLLPPFVGFLFVSKFSRSCLFLQAAVLAFFFLIFSLLEWRMCLCSLTIPDK